MPNKNNKIRIAILKVSKQNNVLLKNYFNTTGKSLYTLVDKKDADAFITDYDYPEALVYWEQFTKKSKKPCIILSINKKDIPNVVWITKPLSSDKMVTAAKKVQKLIAANDNSTVEIHTAETQTETTRSDEIDALLTLLTQKENPKITDLDAAIELIKLENKEKNPKEVKQESNHQLIENQLSDIKDSLDLSENLESSTNKAEHTLAEAENPPVTHPLTNTSLAEYDSKTSKRVVEVNDFLAHDNSIDVNEPFIAEDSSTSSLIDDPSIIGEEKKPLIIEDMVMQDAPILSPDEVTFVETLEIDFKHTSTDTHTIETETLPPDEEEMQVIIEEDGSSLDLMDLHADDLGDEDFSPDSDSNIHESIYSSTEKVEKVVLDTQVSEINTNEVASDAAIEKKEQTNEEKAKSTDFKLQSLLNEVRQEANKKSNTKQALSAETDAEKRLHLLCGDTKKPLENKDTKISYYTLKQHMLAILLKQTQTAKREGKNVLRLKYNDVVIVINIKDDSIYCNYLLNDEAFADFCFNTINPDNVKVHELDYNEIKIYKNESIKNPEKVHSFEAFIWSVSLLTSRGRLLENTDLNKKIRLKVWPDLTRIESFPYVINIAAMLNKKPSSLKDIPRDLEIPSCYVYAFYNAAMALNMIELNSSNLQSTTASFTPASLKKKENQGVVGKLLRKLMS